MGEGGGRGGGRGGAGGSEVLDAMFCLVAAPLLQ